MSGIELAGILLALFPIVVDGISSFVEGTRNIRYWRRYRAQVKTYSQRIELQRAAYLNALEELLADIVHSDDELTLLLVDPTGDAWKSPEYDGELRRCLWWIIQFLRADD